MIVSTCRIKKRQWNRRFRKNRHFLPKINIFSPYWRIFNDNDPLILILRIECAYTEKWGNGGGATATAENYHLPTIFLPILAELDISESFETNFFSQKNPLDFAFDTCR